MHPLHPSVKTVWIIKLGLFSAVLFAGALFYDLTGLLSRSARLLPFGAASGLVLVAGLVLSIALPLLRYRYWRYDLRPEELYLERGIFNRVRTIVPLRRIQHLDVSQDLLEREFDLGKLIVHTAGSRSSDVVLPGLLMEDAERLRDDLRHYITEDAI